MKLDELKIGDKIYMHDTGGRIYEHEIDGIRGVSGEPLIYSAGCIDFDYHAVGNAIFFTEQDAKDHYEQKCARKVIY